MLPLLSLSGGADETDDYLEEQQAKATKLLTEWRAAGSPTGGEAHKELREQLIEAAVRADKAEIIDEIAAGGDVASKEIPLPAEITQVETKELFRLGVQPEGRYGRAAWVIRRMTKTRFEVWTPKRGWLFDPEGKLVNEVTVPRRDGAGREWYGAFLPDGRWVTTDLWDFDKTLHFFSKKGKYLKDMSSTQLAPLTPEDRESSSLGSDIIGWARCDRDGKGWVVSIGSEWGRAVVFVTPDGKVRRKEIDPWRLCYPRDLEPKGYYIALSIPSDDGKDTLSRNVPGHGPWVGYPGFDWNRIDPQNKIIADGGKPFGFMPGSRDVYIGAYQPYLWAQEETLPSPGQASPRTWFFNPKGACRGWVKGTYLTDSADQKAVLLRDNANGVTTLDLDLKPISRERYSIDETPGIPVKLFTDLRLGLFLVKGELILAKW